MEAEELTVGRVHHGHNIRRFRIKEYESGGFKPISTFITISSI